MLLKIVLRGCAQRAELKKVKLHMDPHIIDGMNKEVLMGDTLENLGRGEYSNTRACGREESGSSKARSC